MILRARIQVLACVAVALLALVTAVTSAAADPTATAPPTTVPQLQPLPNLTPAPSSASSGGAGTAQAPVTPPAPVTPTQTPVVPPPAPTPLEPITPTDPNQGDPIAGEPDADAPGQEIVEQPQQPATPVEQEDVTVGVPDDSINPKRKPAAAQAPAGGVAAAPVAAPAPVAAVGPTLPMTGVDSGLLAACGAVLLLFGIATELLLRSAAVRDAALAGSSARLVAGLPRRLLAPTARLVPDAGPEHGVGVAGAWGGALLLASDRLGRG